MRFRSSIRGSVRSIPADYREFALPHTRTIFEAIGKRVPTIHFGTGTATILEELRDAGGDVIGVDWRIPIDEAWERIGEDHAVQGNLDPTLLLGPPTRMMQQTDAILRRVGRTSRPHLQPRPRHSSFDAGRARADARALRPHRLTATSLTTARR